ncbi:hypothetical protein IT774_05110 [Salinimonas marina]|uniref:Peptidase n=1 Tax=Salinimonas marina TaxID=2785918 RepID=A0A7S9DZ00_9ALTE|nr:hypothetical protein [Salinimonas marina]QPG06553.1 hypothetical protein IT774_05110 [Salinimonas marina]
MKSLDVVNGHVDAVPHQVNADFAEMVKDGAFKKVSASWYMPDHPGNPKPGAMYLRHVGFLGAQPPAIKGLRGAEFAEDEDHDSLIVNFEESLADAITLDGIGGVFKRLREFLIDKFSREEADAVVPDYVIQDLQDAAKHKAVNAEPFLPHNYNENQTGEPMTLEELQAQVAQLQADNATLTATNAQLTTDNANFAEQKKAIRTQAIEAGLDKLIADGKLASGNKAQALAFCEAMEAGAQMFEFGEGDEKTQATGADALITFLGTQSAVDFKEQSAGERIPAKPFTAQELAAKALEFQEAEKAQGRVIHISQAVNAVQKQQLEQAE